MPEEAVFFEGDPNISFRNGKLFNLKMPRNEDDPCIVPSGEHKWGKVVTRAARSLETRAASKWKLQYCVNKLGKEACGAGRVISAPSLGI